MCPNGICLLIVLKSLGCNGTAFVYSLEFGDAAVFTSRIGVFQLLYVFIKGSSLIQYFMYYPRDPNISAIFTLVFLSCLHFHFISHFVVIIMHNKKVVYSVVMPERRDRRRLSQQGIEKAIALKSS